MRNAALDLDEQALVKKPRPWGWFAAGLIGLGTVALALGYALPLKRAQELLASEHENLARKARELDQALGKTQSSLSKTEQERASLDQRVSAVQDARQALRTRIDVASATTENQLAALKKAKVMEIAAGPTGVDVTILKKALFLPASAKIAPRLAPTLCKAVAPLTTEKDWKVSVSVPIAADEKEPWLTASEQAAAVAAELAGRCNVDASRLEARSYAGAETGSLALHLGPAELPGLEH